MSSVLTLSFSHTTALNNTLGLAPEAKNTADSQSVKKKEKTKRCHSFFPFAAQVECNATQEPPLSLSLPVSEETERKKE